MALELPEIINITAQLKKELEGKSIREITLGAKCESIIRQGMCNLDARKDQIINTQVKSVTSRGKWIFIEFGNEKFLLFGEVVGKLMLFDKNDYPGNFHVKFVFDDDSVLIFMSTLYAFVEIFDMDEITAHKYAGNIGISPGNKKFTYGLFCKVLSNNQNDSLKAMLVKQGEMSGLGNGYINDILYDSSLHPKRKVNTLSENERKRLYDSITGVIKDAIAKKGCMAECDIYGSNGGYERKMDK